MTCSALPLRTQIFIPPPVNRTADSISRVIGVRGLRGPMLRIFTFVWVTAAGVAAEKKPHALDLTKLPVETLQRYMGRDAAAFLQTHAQQSRPAA